MSEEDLELLITLDDPGEDALEEDTFHHLEAENTSQPFPTRNDTTSEQMSLLIMTARSWLAESCCSRLRWMTNW